MEEEYQAGEYAQDAAGPEGNETETESSESMIPLAALEDERRKRQSLEEQKRLLEDHMRLLQANQAQAPAQQSSESDESDYDVLTVGQGRKELSAFKNELTAEIQELRMMQKHSDYAEVVRDYLPEVINKNPTLKQTLLNDPNRYELAYYLAKNSDSYRESQKKQKRSKEADKIVANSNKPVSVSSVGGAAASAPGGYKNMSDDEFRAFANKYRG